MIHYKEAQKGRDASVSQAGHEGGGGFGKVERASGAFQQRYGVRCGRGILFRHVLEWSELELRREEQGLEPKGIRDFIEYGLTSRRRTQTCRLQPPFSRHESKSLNRLLIPTNVVAGSHFCVEGDLQNKTNKIHDRSHGFCKSYGHIPRSSRSSLRIWGML
jgi:hypothetical protein